MATYKIKRFSISKPYVEISSSHESSSSFYDSKNPENNFNYKSYGNYHDDSESEPKGYEKEKLNTPEVSLEKSRNTDKDKGFKNKVERLLKKNQS